MQKARFLSTGLKCPGTHSSNSLFRFQYEFEGSFLEIYNETIRDLLGQHSSDVKHEIKLTGTGSNDVTVSHLTTVPVTSDQQVRKTFFSYTMK